MEKGYLVRICPYSYWHHLGLLHLLATTVLIFSCCQWEFRQVLHYTKHLQRLRNPSPRNQVVRFSVAYPPHSQINVSFPTVSHHSFINKQLDPCYRDFRDDIPSAHLVRYLHSLDNHTLYPSSYQKGPFTIEACTMWAWNYLQHFL